MKNLDRILCGYNEKKNRPHHSAIIPPPKKDRSYNNLPYKLYCYDARKDECYYVVNKKNKSYCTYREDY